MSFYAIINTPEFSDLSCELWCLPHVGDCIELRIENSEPKIIVQGYVEKIKHELSHWGQEDENHQSVTIYLR